MSSTGDAPPHPHMLLELRCISQASSTASSASSQACPDTGEALCSCHGPVSMQCATAPMPVDKEVTILGRLQQTLQRTGWCAAPTPSAVQCPASTGQQSGFSSQTMMTACPGGPRSAYVGPCVYAYMREDGICLIARLHLRTMHVMWQRRLASQSGAGWLSCEHGDARSSSAVGGRCTVPAQPCKGPLTWISNSGCQGIRAHAQPPDAAPGQKAACLV